ncbi:hypothetical protein [Synechococcus sp. UW179B]|uniref:hypothetical protein n=1 Tax=Synechococcus sp. UW179B TaxID=2575516 RepID=UPI000E0FAFDE|nr:hypothetical protein [Synechococcus sp. UW179B]
MDADFQEQYVAAEQAYSASEFDKADDLARPLLGKLEPLPASGAERDATLAWRAFVALLLGHIHLYGKDDVGQSAEFYRLVLASEPPDTLRELAQQGLNESLERSPVIDVAVSAPAAAEEEPASVPFENQSSQPASDALIRDPFLNTSSTPAAGDQRAAAEKPAAEKPAAKPVETAMPWLKTKTKTATKTNAPPRRELDSAQERSEQPVSLEEAPAQALTPSLSGAFDSNPKRLEAGLLRVHLKQSRQLGSSSAQAADDDQPTSLPLQKRLAMAWRSLSRR